VTLKHGVFGRVPSLDGGSRSDAVRVASVTLQIVHDRIMRFNALGPEGLIIGKALGQQSRLNDSQREQLWPKL